MLYTKHKVIGLKVAYKNTFVPLSCHEGRTFNPKSFQTFELTRCKFHHKANDSCLTHLFKCELLNREGPHRTYR